MAANAAAVVAASSATSASAASSGPAASAQGESTKFFNYIRFGFDSFESIFI